MAKLVNNPEQMRGVSVRKMQAQHSMYLTHFTDNCLTGEELMNVIVRLANYSSSKMTWRKKLLGMALWKVARIKSDQKVSLTEFELSVLELRLKTGVCAHKLAYEDWLKMWERVKAKRKLTVTEVERERE